MLRWLKALEESRDLVNIGAYVPGSDPLLDEALGRREDIRRFLIQGIRETAPFADSQAHLRGLAGVA